jgi:hypothetical protein
MPPSQEFRYDVFLSHSSKDKAVVRTVAERLRKDGLKVWFDDWEIRPGDSIPAKIEEGLEHSRVLACPAEASARRREIGPFRFRGPLNKERCFIPLRLDDAPIKGSLAGRVPIAHLSTLGAQVLKDLLSGWRRFAGGGGSAQSGQLGQPRMAVHGCARLG